MISRFSKQHAEQYKKLSVYAIPTTEKKNLFQKSILKILKSWKLKSPFKNGVLKGVFSFP
jgi:hypothetical protein